MIYVKIFLEVPAPTTAAARILSASGLALCARARFAGAFSRCNFDWCRLRNAYAPCLMSRSRPLLPASARGAA